MIPEWQRDMVKYFASSEPADMEKAFALKAQHLPEFIYKHVGWTDLKKRDQWLSNLLTDSVWLVAPEAFNDPFDSCVRVDAAALIRLKLREDLDAGKLALPPEYLAIIREAVDPLEGIDRAFAASIAEKHGEEVGEKAKNFFANFTGGEAGQMTTALTGLMQKGLKVTCFSELDASLPLWAYYADYHRGMCLEYRVADLPDIHRRLLFPVIYDESRFNPHDIFAVVMKTKQPHVTLPILAAMHKSPDWAHEREWRIVAPQGPSEEKLQIRIGPPSSVRLGCRMKADDRQQIVSVAQSKKIPLFEMALSAEKFELERRPGARADAAADRSGGAVAAP